MSFIVVIPARYASTRLPGKPLLEIGGQSMLQRVWAQSCASGAARVVIATDDTRIESAARDFGAEVCMTDSGHPSGTDRLQEVAARLDFADNDIVVNVQGDEPLIPPAVIDQVAFNLADNPKADIASLCERIDDVSTLTDPNVVKVVTGVDHCALYFSRAPIPWPRDAFAAAPDEMPSDRAWYRHIGIYAYRTAFLHRYIGWQPAPVERLESLEQLRALYNGTRIHMDEACETVPGGVDTRADLEALRKLFCLKVDQI